MSREMHTHTKAESTKEELLDGPIPTAAALSEASSMPLERNCLHVRSVAPPDQTLREEEIRANINTSSSYPNAAGPSSNAYASGAIQFGSFHSKNFAEKLHLLLSVPAYNSILRWNNQGDAFCVINQTQFESVIMSQYFQ